jgi:hypothetical protein
MGFFTLDMPYYKWNFVTYNQRERTMRNLLSTVSPEALFYQIHKSLPEKSKYIPDNWHVRGFMPNQVYVRALAPAEKKAVWNKNSDKFFDWDKKWFGVFYVSTGEMAFVSDSFKLAMQTIEEANGVLMRMN